MNSSHGAGSRRPTSSRASTCRWRRAGALLVTDGLALDAGGGYRVAGNVKRTTLYDVVILFEDIVADDGSEPGADTDIRRGLTRVPTGLATLLKTMPRQS